MQELKCINCNKKAVYKFWDYELNKYSYVCKECSGAIWNDYDMEKM